MAKLFRNPFSFLFARSSQEERVAAYVIREHAKGRPLGDVLEDPYIRNRLGEAERARILDHPDVIHAISRAAIDSARASLQSL